MPTVDICALQRRHDAHIAALRSPTAMSQRQAAHRERMTRKAHLRSHPELAAAEVERLNAIGAVGRKHALENLIATLAASLAKRFGDQATQQAVRQIQDAQARIATRKAAKAARNQAYDARVKARRAEKLAAALASVSLAAAAA